MSIITTPWPWPIPSPYQHLLANGLRLILREAEGLELLGWEASFRLSPHDLRIGRLLLGFATREVAEKRLRQLPQGLAMPPVLAAHFTEHLRPTKKIMLAVELGESGVELKVYQEFAKDNTLAMRGYKWQFSDSPTPKTRISDYRRLPLDFHQMFLWLSREISEQQTPLEIVQTTLEYVHQIKPYWASAELLLVTEPPQTRKSCCLRLYDSGLLAIHLSPALRLLLLNWGNELSTVEQLMRLIGEREVGWLAAGVDSNAQPFVTVYCTAHRGDARAVFQALESIHN